MKIKDSQLHHLPYTEWPLELTPQQREQLLQEKLVRIRAWQQHFKNNDLIQPDVERS
jgi:hypothetical protein